MNLQAILDQLDALRALVVSLIDGAVTAGREAVIAIRADGAVRLRNVEALIATFSPELQARFSVAPDGHRWWRVFDAPGLSEEQRRVVHRATNDQMQRDLMDGGTPYALTNVTDDHKGAFILAGPNGEMFAGVGMEQAVGTVRAYAGKQAQQIGDATFDDFFRRSNA